MGSRLLPLLALLGAAGFLSGKSSEWEGSPAQQPGTTMELEHLFPGSAEPSSSTQKPTASSFLSTLLHPSLAMSSADPEVSRGEVPSGATAMKQGRALGTAGGRTQSSIPDAGRTRPPSALGTSLKPRPMLPSVTTNFLTLFPKLALLPVSISPKDVAVPTSDRSSASEGFPRSDLEERTLEGWQQATGPSVLRGTRGWVVNQTSWIEMGPLYPEPGSKNMARATVAGNETSSVVTAKDLKRTPAVEPSWLNGTSSSLMSQDSKTSPSTTETQGTLLAPTWQPAMETTDPASSASPNLSETLRQEGEVATAMTQFTQLPPQDQSSSPLVMGMEPLPQQSGGSKAHVQLEVTPGLDPDAGPTEPGVAVGPLSSGTALPQSPAGMGHTLEVTEEAAVPDSIGGSTVAALDSRITAPGQRTKAAEEAPPPSPASSAVTPNHGADGTEVTPHSSSTSTAFSSSSGTTVPLSLVGSAIYPPGSDNVPYAINPTPGPSLLTLSVGPVRLLADFTEGPGALRPGQDANVAVTTHPRSTDPVSGTGPLRPVMPQDGPAIAMEEMGGSQETPGSSEPFTTWSAQSSPGSTRVPLQGAFSGPARSSAETSVYRTGPIENGWVPADSRKEPQTVPAVHTEQTVREGSTPDAAPRQTSQSATDGTFMGTATEKVPPPISQNPSRGDDAASQAPSLTESPTGSETASLSMEGDMLNFAHLEDPEFAPSPMTVFPTSASKTAVPTSETGAVAAASDWLLVTFHPAVLPARTQRWEWGRRPSGPTESSVREELARSPHSSGPVQPMATSGPLESSWHTWPPMPAPEPGSASRGGDPAIASTWLVLAPGPEEASTHPVPALPNDVRSRARQVFIVENQPPLLKAAFLHIPYELVLAMEFSRSFRNPHSSEYQGLVLSINETVAPLFASLPGFQRLEVKTIRPGSVVVEFDALFLAEASGLWAALNRSWLSERLPPGVQVANARVLRSTMLERQLDLCAVLFSCHAGYECIAGEDGNATCTSMCHRDYCQNQGICTHEANRVPVCQCPVGSDFWFLGMRCNYKVTQQGLLGVACGLLLSLVVVGTAIASLVIRRVRMLLLEVRADQTKSSYRRFCRLDDVSAHYWSEPWLASASSLDNPAFSNSEELLHLQILDTNCCSCQDDCVAPNSYCKQLQDTPCISVAGRPSSHYNWDTSSNSVNDPMIDSGKASEVSVSSWPLEPIQWSPFPVLHKLSRQQVHKSERPHSYCEGMELVNLERSWTA